MFFESIAEVNCRMPSEFCEYRKRLTHPEQQVYDVVCGAIAQRKQKVTFFAAPNVDMTRVVSAIFMDQPMFFYLSPTEPFHTSRTITSITASWQFCMPQGEIASYVNRLDRRIRALRLSDGGTPLQRELRVHNLMQRMGLVTGSSIDWKNHCIIGPLLEKKTVCEGCAKLFLLLCAMCGVYCMHVSGIGIDGMKSGPHSWNIVQLNEFHAHVDAYWDCLIGVHRDTFYSYDYFNLSDAQIKSDHSWMDERIPACSEERYSYFALCHTEVPNSRELDAVKRKIPSPWQRKEPGPYNHILVRLNPQADETQTLEEIKRCFQQLPRPSGTHWDSPRQFLWRYNARQRVFQMIGDWSEK